MSAVDDLVATLGMNIAPLQASASQAQGIFQRLGEQAGGGWAS